MTEYKKLYNQIDKLNNKIKKLESSFNIKKSIENTNSNLPNNNFKSSALLSYRIHLPKETYSNKKYIGLMFDNNLNNYNSDDNLNNSDEKNIGSKNLSSFIKLNKSNIIMNYSIQLEIDFTPIDTILCSIALGIRTIIDSKIRIIKGTKYTFDLTNSNIINNKFIITNNILYSSEDGEELCIIADFGSNCIINSKKSIIKLLYV
jgi:hypothetical protein